MEAAERYLSENGTTVFEIGVRSINQLFDMRDPSPFRERDLDDDLVEYIVSRVQEFPLHTPVKLRFLVSEQKCEATDVEAISTAVHIHFSYEADLLQQKLKKNYRTARVFLFIGLISLSVCLGAAEFVASRMQASAFQRILQEGFTISGWVAMWGPIEVLLYSWWPIREQKRYFRKLSQVPVEVRSLK